MTAPPVGQRRPRRHPPPGAPGRLPRPGRGGGARRGGGCAGDHRPPPRRPPPHPGRRRGGACASGCAASSTSSWRRPRRCWAWPLRFRPDQVSLVPERPEEVTTEGGLDVVAQGERMLRAAGASPKPASPSRVFLDPDPAADRRPGRAGRPRRTGGRSSASRSTPTPTRAAVASTARCRAGRHACRPPRAPAAASPSSPATASPPPTWVRWPRCREVEELNIGHGLISRAVFVGLAEAVLEMLAAIRER